MSQLGATNLNLNLNLGSSNLNLGGGSLGGGTARGGRVNTQEFRKLVNRGAFPFVPGSAAALRNTIDRIQYPQFWDPDLQSYLYLNEFVRTNAEWFPELVRALTPTATALYQKIDEQLAFVVDAAPEREARYAEIIQQDSADGALAYWTGMLALDVGHMPASRLVLHVARRIGELVAMCLKHAFRVPRPSQLCPAIVPMIDPPATPSFPSGHSLQAHLISNCLKAVRADWPQADGLLEYLAARVAENREIAGVHYPLDSEGGKSAAYSCFGILAPEKGVGILTPLLNLARQEFLSGGNSSPAVPEGAFPMPNNALAVAWGRLT